MAYVRLTFGSKFLRGQEDISVFLPSALPVAETGKMKKIDSYDKREKYQVLWLMHGGGDDHTAWPMDAMIQRACNTAQLIVVMPTLRDFVSNRPDMDTFAYVAKELPAFIGRLFPISRRREDNFIAGLSYGGYFSYRVALNYPQNYACVGSFSSPVDVQMDINRMHKGQPRFDVPIAGTDRDVLGMAADLKARGADIPRMFQTVGTEDFTWDFNVSARNHFRALKLDHTWTERPGAHNFDYWDVALKQYLDWLPLKRAPFIEEGE
ncbi:MAG: alpha/beta hydrolase-fold protein [Eubacteriales bacterium]|nr:alpha/beta hydrolase-fold protein [Eubacteriales bacterium]